jgi:hypothetical protein
LYRYRIPKQMLGWGGHLINPIILKIEDAAYSRRHERSCIWEGVKFKDSRILGVEDSRTCKREPQNIEQGIEPAKKIGG